MEDANRTMVRAGDIGTAGGNNSHDDWLGTAFRSGDNPNLLRLSCFKRETHAVLNGPSIQITQTALSYKPVTDVGESYTGPFSPGLVSPKGIVPETPYSIKFLVIFEERPPRPEERTAVLHV